MATAVVAESTFLSGKVVKRSLPVIQGKPSPGAPTVKRMMLPQGELVQFYDADEPIRYLAYTELREGSIRGNHYHKVKEELIYMIQGEMLLVVEDVTSGALDSVPLRAGDVAMIQPGVAHAWRTVKPGQAIEFSKSRFDASDSYNHPLS
jgi:mannose-6-phosphate isomerase-like protein (cupin superfamily)